MLSREEWVDCRSYVEVLAPMNILRAMHKPLACSIGPVLPRDVEEALQVEDWSGPGPMCRGDKLDCLSGAPEEFILICMNLKVSCRLFNAWVNPS